MVIQVIRKLTEWKNGISVISTVDREKAVLNISVVFHLVCSLGRWNTSVLGKSASSLQRAPSVSSLPIWRLFGRWPDMTMHFYAIKRMNMYIAKCNCSYTHIYTYTFMKHFFLKWGKITPAFASKGCTLFFFC
jgi:hypothetical protein